MSQENSPDDIQPASVKRSLPITVILTFAVLLGIAVLLAVLSIIGILDGRRNPQEDTTPFIQVLNPVPGEDFPILEAVTISGTASGLFESSLFVQVLNSQKKILVEIPASIKIEEGEVGFSGSWSVQVIVDASPGTSGSVRAYAPSLDNSRIAAEDIVQVNFTSSVVETYIDLLEPGEGAILDINAPLLVGGMAGNLFEGALLVEALDESGNILAFQPATVDSPNAGIGEEGPWQVELSVIATPGTKGYLRAYASSPKDGSVVAEDSIQVTFGEESSEILPYIDIMKPLDGDVLDVSRPVVISGMGRGLFEGNVVVEAVDRTGNVMAQQATLLQSDEAGTGGEGLWSVSLVINSAAGNSGMIRAFSDSPVDGSIVAMDYIFVTFGQEQPVGSRLPVESTAWQLISIADSPVLEGSQVWIQFKDGTLSGSAGCNSYFSDYRADEGTVSIAPVATTRKLCSEPDGVMQQESVYTSLLENTVTYAIEGSQLTLANATGEVILVYHSAVAGTVTAEEGSQIAQSALITISLDNAPQADTPAVTLSEMQITGVTGFPFPFILPFDLELINSQMSYNVKVQITGADGALLYTNKKASPVLTGGNPMVVDVLVEKVE